MRCSNHSQCCNMCFVAACLRGRTEVTALWELPSLVLQVSVSDLAWIWQRQHSRC